jgi:alkylation response protein AidB-like acyl-CoA dehydrogenase
MSVFAMQQTKQCLPQSAMDRGHPRAISWRESIAEVLPIVRAARDDAEARRCLPPHLVSALADAGLFWMLTPRSLGGRELDPLTRMEMIEALARVDGSTAWCVEIGSGTAWMLSGWLREDVARELLCREPRPIVAGAVANPAGRARKVDGGYRVTGRWAWGSGCTHSTWFIGGCLVTDGDQPCLSMDGTPVLRSVVMSSSEVQIIDTWTSTGLRGSGSHDYAVQDIFVPEECSFWLPSDPPYQAGPLFAFRGIFLCAAAAIATGIARGAIDTLVELAGSKVPSRSTALLRERPTVQAQVARAVALVESARALAWQATTAVWNAVQAGLEVSVTQRALYRLAITNAVSSAVEAVDLVYSAGGGTSVFASSSLDRAFRDVHTLAQHATLGHLTLEPAGRMFLGLDPGAPLF